MPGPAGDTAEPRAGPPPAAPRRPPSLLGIVIVATAGLVAAWMTLGVFLPAIGEIGRAGQNPAALPRTLALCDRTWDRGEEIQGLTIEEVFARDDRGPVVVTGAGAGVCPAGACGAGVPDEGCSTVVYVKRGDDEYVRYELVVEE